MTCTDHYHCRAFHSVAICLQAGLGTSSLQAEYRMGACAAHRMACASPGVATSTLPCPTCGRPWTETDDDVDARAEIAERRRCYFRCDDGAATYTVVAYGIAHAKTVLRTASRENGVEFDTDGGASCSYDDAKHLEWRELAADTAATITIDNDGVRELLTNQEPGDWFCSEY